MEIERFYRSVLLSYPAPYRAERGEEMLAVLMETAPAGGRPSAGETMSLIRHGLALRLAGRSRPVGSWRRPAAAGVVCLSSLLAVFAMVAASALSGSVVWSGFHGEDVYLDPLWPTYLLWLGTFAFSYLLLIGLADGSGSRLPDGPVALPLTLGVLPLAGLVVLVALIRHFEAYGIARRAALRFLESLIGAVRG
jgi:hypothetical protein